MNDRERNYYNAFVQIRDFGAANHDEIKKVAAAVANFALVAAGVEAIEENGALQSSGAAGSVIIRKYMALADLRAGMRTINRTSRALAVDNPAIAELFRMPHGNNEQQTIAVARAFLTSAAPIRQLFIDYGLAPDFINVLEDDITDYEQAIAEKNTALADSVGATANIGATVEETLNAMRRLRGIVPNIFAGSAGKLAEWKSACHVARAPKSRSARRPPAEDLTTS